ncbi:uncharacterized protein LOC112191810 isoform X1 [Rosa chinensis]|uniref:uncharacterized protein LOC112191810 isoform X1 n=1 Tax=Rosa chinensis TaxID=74649 RepID=UPI000D09316A|nr:uncharacterized protein LOC112191810 isoform X1 [Rosa chinensis]
MEKQAAVEGSFGYGQEDSYDAVVVGSGYGGSVAACHLSMAGIRVCLIEKGRKWESQDFPTDVSKILQAFRMENENLGFSFGPKDALFQVYEQNDSLAAVACGLGGGSLVNAGVMISTPVRARRHPKWPKEWERNWNNCEASAAAMLKIQSIPVKFPSAKILEEVAYGELGETFETSVKLSVNFDIEEPITKGMKSPQMSSCLACGNCLSGCPYNAKSSTDKNYILSAIQGGCIVKTECQVKYVVRNMYENFPCEGKIGRKNRRWRVYFNEIDYITSDFVILSAGVFGTTEILFQSQMRGLKLSEALGSGFSCNGNTVAYLAGSPAPLGAYGLDRKQVFKTPFEERPGPSISSSYTSSLGFTIQSAVLPTAYPYLLFKGITTYGWPAGYWFFHGIIDKIKHIIGFKACQAMALIALGHDESDGKITLEKGTNKICFTPPHDPLLPRKIKAFQKLTKKLGGILFMAKYRSASVHHLGGCNASSDPSHGVCNPDGQVFDPKSPATVHPGLYVCDASLIPCSVGINPSLTIATAAEYVSRYLVQDILMYKNREGLESGLKSPNQDPESFIDRKAINRQRSSVTVKETMRGYIGGMPCTAYLIMKMNSQNQTGSAKWKLGNGKSHPLLRGKVGGHVEMIAIEKDNLHIIDGNVNLCAVDDRTPYTQYMHYRLLLVASTGSRYILEGRKIMNPYLFPVYAWREMTTLHVTFAKVAEKKKDEKMILKGELNISMIELLKSTISLEGNNRGRFICLLLGSLLRTYLLQIPRGSHEDLDLSVYHRKSYPSSTLHEIQTEDGFLISCRQWKSHHILSKLKGDEQQNPVLLLNGYSTESYWLPTEPNDLVRSLLEEGHDTWLLQPRLHPLNPSNNFTIEDVARFDIPAAINKILELHGPSAKVHVVAHCVGGLSMHIAVMGGHVSATHVASLSCTNSSMFFNLNAFARVKMWLPLIPISMFILGEDKTVPLLEASNLSLRHHLLRLTARFIPRYERCTCNECEVFSGMFGNTFWHENITPTMHQWLNKQSSTRLPMSAFPHLRKICNSGFIVDSNGCSSYLIHPERMALPTLYISGGRSLLVTPQTSFLAHKYMKLHQPGFRHERVVVEGFGHSDLLIGEESHKKVFPHILSHIRLAEQGEIHTKRNQCSKEALDWEADQLYDGSFGQCGTWFSPFVIFSLIFMLLSLLHVLVL